MRKQFILIVLAFLFGTANSQEPTLASGTPAELEKKIFGGYLEPGKTPALRNPGFNDFNLRNILLFYGMTGQYAQRLRICRFQERLATNAAEKKESSLCIVGALLSLGRYAEGEDLFYSDEARNLDKSSATPMQEVNELKTILNISLNQGNTSLALMIVDRIIALYPALRIVPTTWDSSDKELFGTGQTLMKRLFDEDEAATQKTKTRLIYFEQDKERYQKQLNIFLTLLGNQSSISRNLAAMDETDALVRVGESARAIAIARKALPDLEMEAGFRALQNPLTNDVMLKAETVVLGDERTNTGFVKSRLRVVKAYILLNRMDDAMQLLMTTHKIALRYEMQELSASIPMAQVEEVFAAIAIQQKDPEAAIAALRSARKRILAATLLERSSTLGQRRIPFDTLLSSVQAKLIGLIAEYRASPVQDDETRQLILEIMQDFSASRADVSVRQAAYSLRSPDATLKQALYREGLLVDELMEQRGLLAVAAKETNTLTIDRAATQTRVREITAELRAIKADIFEHNHMIDAKRLAGAALKMPQDTVHWQWILHPDANTIIAVTGNGIWLHPLDMPVTEIRQHMGQLQHALTPKTNWKPGQLPPYPRQAAGRLFSGLFSPIALTMPPARQWIISPPALLDRIPWSALIPADDKPVKPSAPWLVDLIAITMSPSYSASVELDGHPLSRASRPFLGVGDPLLSAAPVNLSSLSTRGSFIATFASSAPIETVTRSSFGRELNSAAALFPGNGTELMTKQKATKQALLKAPLFDFRILLFSTHGLLGRKMQHTLGPSLLLSGGKNPSDRFLTAAEIGRLRLDADLVILSACDTSASDGLSDGEGFSGLTSAFLLAGARTVLATLWPVETSSTETLIVDALKAYRQAPGSPVAFALRQAMLAKAHGNSTDFRHPYFWSGFVAVGR
ncbi:CHAT domain-containing protein [Janthinobacterium sp. PSPC2-1]|uniref:CHAT domain-containing protein n=1 Tax=unclassified Janthinobacterium TaxID=2610881 RepID=UPI003CE6C27E